MAVDERDGALYVSFRQKVKTIGNHCNPTSEIILTFVMYQVCHFYPSEQVVSSCLDLSNTLSPSSTITHLVVDSGNLRSRQELLTRHPSHTRHPLPYRAEQIVRSAE